MSASDFEERVMTVPLRDALAESKSRRADAAMGIVRDHLAQHGRVGVALRVGRGPPRTVERSRQGLVEPPAVDVALADLAAKRLDIPLYRQLGLDPAATPVSSFSIGSAAPDEMRRKAERAVQEGYSVLKVKLGTGDDADAS